VHRIDLLKYYEYIKSLINHQINPITISSVDTLNVHPRCMYTNSVIGRAGFRNVGALDPTLEVDIFYNYIIIYFFFFFECRIRYRTFAIILVICSLLTTVLNRDIVDVLNHFRNCQSRKFMVFHGTFFQLFCNVLLIVVDYIFLYVT
jgi:hypothetical protein